MAAKGLIRIRKLVGRVRGKGAKTVQRINGYGSALRFTPHSVLKMVGAPKHMHTVLAQECTSCELCLEPCPVDCITMAPVRKTIDTWKWPYPATTPQAASVAAH